MNEIDLNIQGYNENGICVACLNYNRKMFYADEVKECYELLGNIDVPVGRTVQVCWECLAAMRVVNQFRKQVRKAFAVLKDYSRKHRYLESPSALTKHAVSRLSSHVVSITSTQWSPGEGEGGGGGSAAEDRPPVVEEPAPAAAPEEVKLEIVASELYADPLGSPEEWDESAAAQASSESDDEVVLQIAKRLRRDRDSKSLPMSTCSKDLVAAMADEGGSEDRKEEQPFKTPVQSPSRTSTDDTSQLEQDNDLLRLLNSNFEASSLLAYLGKSLPNDQSRNFLAATICKHILSESRNERVPVQVYSKWAEQIKALFPSERIATFYVPATVTYGTSSGVKPVRGKLVNQLMNTRRKYQKLGVLDPREKKLKPDVVLRATSSPRPLPSSLHSKQCKVNKADIAWLKSKSEPWGLVETKWKATLSHRSQELRQPGFSPEQYLKDYPALRCPVGFNLLLEDFKNLYPNDADNFYSNFPKVKDMLIEQLKKKNVRDTYLGDIVDLADDPNEDNSNLAAILSLPELIKSSPCSLPLRTVASLSDAAPSSAKKQKLNESKWKPTKDENREGFVTRIHDESYLKLIVNKRHQKYTKQGFSLQPYVAIVGHDLRDIKSYLVVVDPSTLYRCPDILAAIDTCFKTIWSLNLEYPYPSYGPWYFLQKGLYKMSTPFDRGSTSVESLMTDCNLIN